MKKYLLPKEGSFYKANLHSHSTLSDGALTPEEMKQLYRSNGYSILAYTDHSVFVPHNDLTDSTFLALNGSEEEVFEPVSGKVWHACFIALDSSMTEGIDMRGPEKKYDPGFINTVMERGREGGFFVTYNHPDWSMENYGDYMNYHGMHAMEIVNFGCIEAGYARAAYECDWDGRPAMARFYDEFGQPARFEEGYEAVRMEYDEDDNVIWEAYYLSDGSPVKCLEGYEAKRRVVDRMGRVLLEQYLDTQGNPMQAANSAQFL